MGLSSQHDWCRGDVEYKELGSLSFAFSPRLILLIDLTCHTPRTSLSWDFAYSCYPKSLHTQTLSLRQDSHSTPRSPRLVSSRGPRRLKQPPQRR